MAISNKPPTLNNVKTSLSGLAWSHTTTDVVWTATLKNGSVLDNSNVEVSPTNPEDGVKVVDDSPEVSKPHRVGDLVTLNVATRGCFFNEDALTTTGGKVDYSKYTSLIENNVFVTVGGDQLTPFPNSWINPDGSINCNGIVYENQPIPCVA